MEAMVWFLGGLTGVMLAIAFHIVVTVVGKAWTESVQLKRSLKKYLDVPEHNALPVNGGSVCEAANRRP